MQFYSKLLVAATTTLYHGTSSLASYQGIVKNGLSYTPSDNYEGHETFKPLEGAYLTKEFGNGVRYSFMGNRTSNEPNGYVLEFSSSDLSGTTPDEDELGSAFEKLVQKGNLPSFIKAIVDELPPQISSRMGGGEFEVFALLGKWLIRHNKLSKQVMDYLSKNSLNVVNYGVIHPIAVWVIPKPNEEFLRDRAGTFNTFGGYASYGKRYGKRFTT